MDGNEGPYATNVDRLVSDTPYTFPPGPRADYLTRRCSEVQAEFQACRSSFNEQSEEIQRRLDLMSNSRFIHESNRLEGLGYAAFADTERQLEAFGYDFDSLGRRLAEEAVRQDKHLVETVGLHRAVLLARDLIATTRSRPLTEVDLRQLHGEITTGESYAGRYKDYHVEISGSDHEPPSPVDTPAEMARLVAWLNETTAPAPLVASVVHAWLTHIHPFSDGNGRLARLVANVALLRDGFPPLIVRSDDRTQYLDALRHSDEGGDLLPLFELFVERIHAILKEYRDPDKAQELYKLDLRSSPERRFAVWSDLLTQFLDQLRGSLDAHGFRLYRKTVPTERTFRQLCGHNGSASCWLAKVLHETDGRDFILVLGYMSNDLDSEYHGPGTLPSIFVTAKSRDPDGIRSYQSIFEPPFEPHEFAIEPGELHEPCLVLFDRVPDRYPIDMAGKLAASSFAGAPAQPAR